MHVKCRNPQLGVIAKKKDNKIPTRFMKVNIALELKGVFLAKNSPNKPQKNQITNMLY